jgi:hypothetical protein
LPTKPDRSDNRRIVDKALGELTPFLEAFLLGAGIKATGYYPKSGDADPQPLIAAFINEWDKRLAGLLPRRAKSYFHSLRDIRNDHTHFQTFTDERVDHVLTTVDMVREVINAPPRRERAVSPIVKQASVKPKIGAKSSQRDVMRTIFARNRDDHEAVIRDYVAAEARGEVERRSNKSGHDPEQYARALLSDGLRKGWLK